MVTQTRVGDGGPVGYSKLVGAQILELREQNSGERTQHDIAVLIERDHGGTSFSWRAKGTLFPSSLSDHTPDPFDPIAQYRKPCTCFVEPACPCENPESAIELRSGSITADVVEAFLASVSRQDVMAEDSDAGSRYVGGNKAHVVVFGTGIPDAIHLRLSSGDWRVNGRSLAPSANASDASASPEVNVAYEALRSAIGLPKWVESMNSAAGPGLPADFADMAKAQRVEVFDSWNGFGSTHGMFSRLVRNGKVFDSITKFTAGASCAGENTPDPYMPKKPDAYSCACDVDQKCACECAHYQAPELVTSKVDGKLVEEFLSAMSRRGLFTGAPTGATMGWHTDDYPRGHVVVWVTDKSDPIHLSFPDQARQWHVNGLLLATSGDGPLWAAYHSLLDEIGLSKWITKNKAAAPHRQIHR